MTSRVPAAIQARRRDLPALAWVLSMAYSASPRPPRWLHKLRGVVAWHAWFTVLLIAVVTGSVCAIERQAVLLAQNRRESVRVRVGRTLLALPMAVAAASALVALTWTTAELVWWILGFDRTSPWLARSALLGALTPIGAAALGIRPVATLRAAGGTAVTPAVKELHTTRPNQPVWLLSLLGAWPQSQGHGRLLMRAVLAPGLLPGSIVLSARDDHLVETYERYGLQRRNRSRVMTRTTATDDGRTPPPPS